MMIMKVKTPTLKTLNLKVLNDLPGAINKALEKAAHLVEREAKILAPVLTGRLRSSIFVLKGHVISIQPNVIYGHWASKRAKEPGRREYMFKGAKKASDAIDAVISNEVDKVLRKI